MGRYYNGDIDGKFWFAVQSSNAADRFGVTGTTPNTIEYCFGEDDLEGVILELKEIEELLGDNKKKLDDFFKENNSYNDKQLSETLGLPADTTGILLSNYADYELGTKIKECLEEHGSCNFEGEA